MRVKSIAVPVVLFLLCSMPVYNSLAQHQIRAWAFGSNGISSNNDIAVKSTAGQPVTGMQSGDTFTLYSGFWFITATQIVTTVELPESCIPGQYILMQNYPNPFNPATTIRFGLPSAGDVQLIVYDILGRKITTLVDEYKEAGYHDVIFSATDLSSGIYLYRIRAGDFVKTKRFLVLK